MNYRFAVYILNLTRYLQSNRIDLTIFVNKSNPNIDMHHCRLVLFLLLVLPSVLFADSYPEVVFANSAVKGTYAKSNVTYNGNSWIENINKRLLVSDSLFFTPGNSLSLKYLSSEDGYWESNINYSRQKYNYTLDNSDFLTFRLYIRSTKTTKKELPKVYIRLHKGVSDTLTLDPYISKIEHNKWLLIKIPVRNFKIPQHNASILGIGFCQHEFSKEYQHLFIDQIEFLPNKFSEIPLRSAAVLSEVTPFDKAIHLKWQLPLTPSIRYIKIYRSEDGQNFEAVSIRPIHMQSCLDIIPNVGQKYFYKITWVDYNYQESPASVIKEVQSQPLKDDEILKLVQLAHVNYFVENFDINTGMYMPFRSKNKVVVSTQETAGAILSLIVGVKNEFVTRQNALNRISKISFFLLRSQNKNGFFPSFYDARKGIPEYRNELSIYDVPATGAIIEALLIAREFFNGDSPEEKDLRSRITELYQQVNWKAASNNEHLLKTKLALLEENNEENSPLMGIEHAMNTYLLAIGDSKYALPSSTLHDAIYYYYQKVKTDTTQSVNPYYYDESILEDEFYAIKRTKIIDTTIKVSVFDPIQAHGLKLPFGKLKNSLLDFYKPFLTIKPNLINDSLTDWHETLNTYLQYVKRRDNELGASATNSDIWGYYKTNDSLENHRINTAIAPASISIDKYIGTGAIINLYKQYGHILFTEFGFRSWLDLRNDDVSDEYISANQAAIAVMVENARTGLIWELYEKIPELKQSRQALFGNKKQ